jgi:hypothetical protein
VDDDFMTDVVDPVAAASDTAMIRSAGSPERGERDVREFANEVAVLSRWLGRDVAADLGGVVPVWHAFRFRDATVFEADQSECARRMFLVRGESVGECALSQMTIDEAYRRLDESDALPAVA